MATTRDDVAEINCRLNEYNNSLGYMLNVPGNGTHPEYIMDPQVRLQKFGANLSVNIVDINSELLGVNKQLDRDKSVENTRDNFFNPTYKQYTFPSITHAITDQSRAIQPAWELRGLEQTNWQTLLNNPQNNYEIQFAHNINSRQEEKDTYRNNCGM